MYFLPHSDTVMNRSYKEIPDEQLELASQMKICVLYG